ncbi:mobilization protein [uncultured Desulfuromusa sp.]|uniref:mobilization protein n=1 Tax=uncultured Desulfuromusa sp. TaxID=219183 RepID=UPI002AA88571|nr:mobilization protein [uncultured Desulfuromusa sp.]
MSEIKEKIQKQQQKINQEKARLKRLRAKATAEARKVDTRRKILIGAAMLAKAQNNEAFNTNLMQVLDQYLTADRDRQLFDFPAMEHHQHENGDY